MTATVTPIRPVSEWPEAGLPDLAALGLTYRRLDMWTRVGHVHCENPDPGSGVPRTWSGAELEIARRMVVLTAAGLELAAAAAFARGGWPEGEIAPGITVSVVP